MPELPEVETIKIQLGKFLVGHKILSIDIKRKKTFPDDEQLIIGSKIIGTRRFGKVTVIDLDNKYSIITHVKMSGQFIYKGPNLKSQILSKKVIGGLDGKHTMAIFNLDKNGKLYYNDVRRFGWIKIVKTNEVENEKFINKLGPEPHIAKDFAGKELDFSYFTKLLTKSKRNIKTILMDQSKIGGIGNIYVNDALWLSSINPKRISNTLTPTELKKLYQAIFDVLKSGLKYGGASELAFVTPDGKEGEYQNHTLVYGHQGEICNRCKKSKIEKLFIGGRGTYFCPSCQL